MKLKKTRKFAILFAIASALVVPAFAGTFANITIDGSFSDWAGVPLTYSQPRDSTTSVAFQNISVANDDNYLYIMFTLYAADNPFTAHQNIFVNADNNSATGYVPFFGAVPYANFGSEMLVQLGAGYQQESGVYNAGAINGLNWSAAPAGTNTQFELRISRHATYASDGTPVFTSNTITFALEAEDSTFTTQEFAPTNGSGGLVYTFATAAGGVTITDPTQPLDQSVVAGSPVVFNVEASGSAPLHFQWFKNSGALPNATNASYTNLSAQIGDNGATYYCQVTNSINATNSRTATLSVSATANTFRTITIDGSFSDWAGIPAYTQAKDSTTSIAYQNIYVCNDSNYLYIRFSIYPPADNPFTSFQNIFIDADTNAATGYAPFGYSGFGSEMLVQAGAAYQQKNGGFNEGNINGLNWSSAPAAPATEFEFQIARNATYASDGTPVFTKNTISFVLEADDSTYNPAEYAPTAGSGGLHYTFATGSSVPGPLSVFKTNGNIAISWPGAGTLQSRSSFTSGSFSNVPGVVNNPYIIPPSGTQQYYRLVE